MGTCVISLIVAFSVSNRPSPNLCFSATGAFFSQAFALSISLSPALGMLTLFSSQRSPKLFQPNSAFCVPFSHRV
jgi:hypothetical protein